MYERILVPLDGSKVGEAALAYVEELVSKLAPETEVEITLFQVISSLTPSVVAGETRASLPYTKQEMEQIKKKAIDYLGEAGKGLESKGAVVRTKVKTKMGMVIVAEEIIKAASEINAGLIAISTHGSSGLTRWAFGSVTDKVLRGANVPVLMVRASKPAK
jgi:nucleotide-binding universal stress UspA family protein